MILGGLPTPTGAAAMGPIAGTVTDHRGQPVSGVTVTIYTRAESAWSPQFQVQTDAEGDYLVGLGNSLASEARVGFSGNLLVPAFYPGAESVDTAESIRLSSAGVADIDISLKGPGQVTGQLSGGSGAVAGATVLVLTNEGGGWSQTDSVITGADGSYTYEADTLDTLSLRFGFTAKGYQTQYYPGVATLDSATSVLLKAGRTRANIDGRLSAVPSGGGGSGGADGGSGGGADGGGSGGGGGTTPTTRKATAVDLNLNRKVVRRHKRVKAVSYVRSGAALVDGGTLTFWAKKKCSKRATAKKKRTCRKSRLATASIRSDKGSIVKKRLPRLKRGKYRVWARFSGTASFAPASSSARHLRVKAKQRGRYSARGTDEPVDSQVAGEFRAATSFGR